MQNRYVGDIGDFGKYGLLRYLTGSFDQQRQLSLGILWYLVANESHNNDGGKTQYLFLPNTQPFEDCDPVLFRALRSIVHKQHRRVDAIESLNLFPPSTVFVDTVLSYEPRQARQVRVSQRQEWLQVALQRTEQTDIVFVDPDNGLECASVSPWERKAVKYAYTSELTPVAQRDQSLVIYHHISRQGTAETQVREWLVKLKRIWPNKSPFALLYRRGSSRAFFVVPARAHRTLLEARCKEMLESNWNRHFQLMSGQT